MDPSYNSSLGNLNPGGTNPNGGFPQPSQPLSSGQGDIVLTPSQPKKSKKTIFFSVIAVIIIALIVTIVVLSINSKNNSEEMLTASLTESFNKYGNYLLYGKTNSINQVIKSENLDIDSTEFFFDTMDQEQLKTLKALYDDYYKKVDTVLNDSYMYEYNLIFDFYYNYLNDNYSSLDGMAIMYDKDGLQATKENINKTLDNYDSSNKEIENYKAYRDRQSELFLKTIAFYDENHCIDNGIDYDCILKLKSPLQASELKELNSIKNHIGHLIEKQRFNLVNYTFLISDVLENGIKYENEE